jgi:hypothetical protein
VVRLSDGRDAVVTSWDVNAPCRPTVEILHEIEPRPQKQRGKVVRIDLREHKELSIVATDGEDVSQDNFEPAEPGEFDLLSLYRSMENRAHGDLKADSGEDVPHEPVADAPASDADDTPPAQAA